MFKEKAGKPTFVNNVDHLLTKDHYSRHTMDAKYTGLGEHLVMFYSNS